MKENDIDTKLKNEAYIRGLEKTGVKVESLLENLKKKKDGTSEGITK